ncbi:MAG: ADP-ribosylation factor-like protein [Candidatus Hodarchaeales archaeon]|jgi:GTPase SAR1 family protein
MSDDSPVQSSKVVMIGLAAVGKSSIKSVVFEGKFAENLIDYNATVNYNRITKNLIGNTFQVLDCGGQESFLTTFIETLQEFIFSHVKVLVWVVDGSNFAEVSKSKYYFDLAINRLHEYSPNAIVYCLFHKTDRLKPNRLAEVVDNMKKIFITKKSFQTKYYATNLYDHSILKAFSDLTKYFIEGSVVAESVKEVMKNSVIDVDDLLGLALYTDNGLSVIEEGDMTEKLILPANLWLANMDRIEKDFKPEVLIKGVLETDNYLYVFQQIIGEFLLAGIVKKGANNQSIMEKIANVVDKIKKFLF